MLLVIVLLIGCICFLLNSSLGKEEYNIVRFEEKRGYSLFRIAKKDIKKEVIKEGIVTGDSYIDDVAIEYSKGYEICVNSGDVVAPKSVIIKVDEENDIVFDKTIRIIDWKINPDEKTINLQILDYSKLYIKAAFEVSYDEIIGNETSFSAEYGEKQLDNVTFLKKGYECYNGNLDVMLRCDNFLLPGSQVKVKMLLEEYKDQWVISKDCIYGDENNYYIIFVDNDIEQKVPVRIVCENETEAAIIFDESYSDGVFAGESNRAE